ncbi:histidine phosphatase family protein [Thermocoleostomius sinensis]|jgi:broad specificity phosphatase PhoE|uniref:Phosphoglycerate mutase family protein n=1 Tax=Thermocoleostomius sinensis A174 TaxID=2016057 RepID=A0A9E8ZH46_9CYAN|nr:phosphoglycerate mutase family protein [Thermocoleostomius sinensis]WAL61724.1 phosphoglycerate mutase family protein [Thermocoleostomius sinensis A174]
MVTVWFIRHAESESNAGLPTRDPASTRITPTGEEQAQQIADCLPDAPSLIVTSPYLRTKQTAQPTIQRFASVPQAEWPIQEFTFLAPRNYYNTTRLQRYPMVQAYWQHADPFYVEDEGAESFADLVGRVEWVRSHILQLSETATQRDKHPDSFIVAFSHGRFIRAVAWVLLVRPQTIDRTTMQQFQAFSESVLVPNGTILKVQAQASEVWLSGLQTEHMQKPQQMISDPQVKP